MVGQRKSQIRVMQERGLEPLHLSVLAPKTSASANSATPAFGWFRLDAPVGVKSICSYDPSDESGKQTARTGHQRGGADASAGRMSRGAVAVCIGAVVGGRPEFCQLA